MAEKNINSRIVHKHDTEANWNKATGFIPKQGEIIIYDIDSNHTYSRVKIGNGTTVVSSLPFLSDVAALDYSGATASGNATSFITQVTQTDGVISATKASIPSASTSAAGLMSAADKSKLDGIAAGATANTGTITGITAGIGIAGGATSGNATIKAKLRSETALTVDSAAATTTSGRVYPVAIDKAGYLAVNVPWTDTNTSTAYDAGTGLSLSGTTFNHSNSITAKTSYGSTATSASANGGSIVVTDIQYDAQGHITATTDRTIKLSQTTYSLSGLGGVGSISASGTAPLTLNASKSGTTVTITGSVATAGSNLGVVKTTSTVTSTSELTACPIINGVVYYKDTNTDTDTGATAITVTGSGNAVTAASYDASTRTITLTKGATYNNYTYTLPEATSSVLGGVKIGSNITVSSGTISLTKANVTAALGYTPPETDTNTTYSAGDGISLSGTTFSNSGVRAIATGTANGTISVNTDGNTTNVTVKGLGSAAYTASDSYASASHEHSAANITSGILPIDYGGTGATTGSDACINIGALPLSGGMMMGVLTAYNPSLSVAGVRNIYAGTSALTAGSSELATGVIYIQYE